MYNIENDVYAQIAFSHHVSQKKGHIHQLCHGHMRGYVSHVMSQILFCRAVETSHVCYVLLWGTTALSRGFLFSHVLVTAAALNVMTCFIETCITWKNKKRS
jgi:hypothetical protein